MRALCPRHSKKTVLGCARAPNGALSTAQDRLLLGALMVCLYALTVPAASAATISGKVVGPDGKPVVGAEVIVEPIYPPANRLTRTTDRAGRFSLDLKLAAAPSEWVARVAVFSPGLAIGGGSLKRGENTIPLERPGKVQGTVTDAAGRPVAGATVRVLHAKSAQTKRLAIVPETLSQTFTAKTGPDGRWAIGGVPRSGTAVVSLDDPRYVHARAEAKLGPAAPPAHLLARAGATVTGGVTYEDHTPASGIRVFAQGQGDQMGWSQTSCGRDGSYRLHSLDTGTYNVMVDDPSGRWVAAAQEGVAAQEGKTTEIPDLVLTTGGLVEGSVVDDASERPLSGVWVGSYGPHRPRSSAAIIGALTDKRGRYRLRVAPGTSYIYVSGCPKGYLQPREGVDVRVAKGETKTVSLRLTKEQAAALLTVRGRVITPDGKPLAQATVNTRILSIVGGAASGGGARPRIGVGERREERLSTDAQGRFSLPGVREDAQVTVTAGKLGYRWKSGGQVTKRGRFFEVSDIVLVPGKAKVEGQVLDQQGRPVAGAKVMSPDGDPEVVVETDAAGHFALDSLPEGQALLVAARGNFLGDVRARGGDRSARITLAPPKRPSGSDLERGYAILKRLWEESAESSYYARESLPGELAPYDPDLALKLGTEPDGSASDRMLQGIVFSLAESDPARAAAWAPSKLARIKEPRPRAFATAYLALAIADLKPELAEELRQALTSASPLPEAGEESQVEAIFTQWMVAALARKLHREEARGLVEAALAATQEVEKPEEQGNDEGRGLLQACLELLARADWRLAMDLAQSHLTGQSQIHALASIIDVVAGSQPLAAYQFVAKIEPPTEEGGAYYYGVAAKSVITAIGSSDPAKALEVARKVQSKEQQPLALALAAQFQPSDLARELFREAAGLASRDAGRVAQFAAMALESDPGLATELFDQARRAAESRGPRQRAAFCFYYSLVAAGEARVMIEADLARALQQGTDSFFSLVPLVLAMAAVDVDRALELARALPHSGSDGHFDAQRKIAQYVIASEPVRRALPFDRWGASDTWRPGSSTGW